MKTFVELVQEIKKSFDQEDRAVLANIENSIELTSTAAYPHAVESYFIFGKTVCETTVAIAVNDTIAIGTNCRVADDIMSVLAQVKNMNNILGAKNLFYAKFDAVKALNGNGSWSGYTYTNKGISFICDVNSNGYITKVTANGTCTSEGDSFFNFYQNKNKFPISKGDYILNGCPVGGNFSNGYALYAYIDSYKVDTGDGVSFSIASDTTIQISIVIKTNCTVSNKVFYPMIRLASDADSTYAPYAKTNQQLTKETIGLLDNVNKLGAKNLLPNNASTTVTNGITFTVNSDGTIRADSGGSESTGAANLDLCTKIPIDYKNNSVIVSGGYGVNGQRLIIFLYDSSQTYLRQYEDTTGNGVLLENTSDAKYLTARIAINAGIVVSNKTFYPMIRLASDPSSEFTPYAKTNRELTEDFKPLKLSFTYPSSITSDLVLIKEIFIDCISYLNSVGDCAFGCITWSGHGYRGFQIEKVTSTGYKGIIHQENKIWTAQYDSSNDTLSAYSYTGTAVE